MKGNWQNHLKMKNGFRTSAKKKKNDMRNIRMAERDLKKIQARAIEEGIPYQSLISMLIHKYNEGKVLIKKGKTLLKT